MSSEFLDILLKEETLIYNQLCVLQDLIKMKGGKPQYLFLHDEEKLSTTYSPTIQGAKIKDFKVNENDRSLLKKELDLKEKKVSVWKFKDDFKILENGYNTGWIWERKTKFAFEFLKRKAYPKKVIDFIIEQEGAIDSADIKKISANIYNIISNLNKKEYLIKIKETGEYEVLTIKKDDVKSSSN